MVKGSISLLEYKITGMHLQQMLLRTSHDFYEVMIQEYTCTSLDLNLQIVWAQLRSVDTEQPSLFEPIYAKLTHKLVKMTAKQATIRPEEQEVALGFYGYFERAKLDGALPES